MEYFTREDCVLAGTEVALRIMAKLGCEVVSVRAQRAVRGSGRHVHDRARPRGRFACGVEGVPERVRPLLGGGHEDARHGGRGPRAKPALRGADHAQEHAWREGSAHACRHGGRRVPAPAGAFRDGAGVRPSPDALRWVRRVRGPVARHPQPLHREEAVRRKPAPSAPACWRAPG